MLAHAQMSAFLDDLEALALQVIRGVYFAGLDTIAFSNSLSCGVAFVQSI